MFPPNSFLTTSISSNFIYSVLLLLLLLVSKTRGSQAHQRPGDIHSLNFPHQPISLKLPKYPISISDHSHRIRKGERKKEKKPFRDLRYPSLGQTQRAGGSEHHKQLFVTAPHSGSHFILLLAIAAGVRVCGSRTGPSAGKICPI